MHEKHCCVVRLFGDVYLKSGCVWCVCLCVCFYVCMYVCVMCVPASRRFFWGGGGYTYGGGGRKLAWNTGWPKNNGTVDFLGLCSDQQLSFFTLLDRTSFPHYNNTKINTFGWKLFILWVISYGLSFWDLPLICHCASKLWKSGKSRKWQSIKMSHKIKSSQPNLMILVLL